MSLAIPSTFAGYCNREVRIHWPLCADTFEFESSREPTYISFLESQFLMMEIVEEQWGRFDELKTSPQRIASQLLDNLSKSALHGIPVREIGERLIAAWTGSTERKNHYRAAQQCIEAFRARCLGANLADLSMVVSLHTALLENETYLKQLRTRTGHVIVEHTEEFAPAAHDLIRATLPTAESGFIAANPDGGSEFFWGLIRKGRIACPNCAMT